MNTKTIGAIEWHDLTVSDATAVADFYGKVVGWSPSAVSMGEYDDFNMSEPKSDTPVAGVCHARGPNQKLPAQWLMYVRVEDIKQSIKQTVALGGTVIAGPNSFGEDEIYVIQDPAGAVLGLVGLREKSDANT